MPTAVLAARDARLVQALRAGDEHSFAELLGRYGPSMRRVARSIVHDREIADEVVQETWLGVVAGIDGFQGRSLLRTWIFRILTNTAISRAAREARSAPFSSLANDADDEDVDADRFVAGDARDLPEHVLAVREALGRLTRTIRSLPPLQRAVVTMRDVEGYAPAEVCESLGLTDANQRVLLHRARSRLRVALLADD